MSVQPRSQSFMQDLRRLDARLRETAGAPRPIGNGLRRTLWLELLHVLNGSGGFEQIPWLVPNTVGLTARVARHLDAVQGHGLARSVYESTRYAGGVDSLLSRNGVETAEWEYFQRLARDLNVPLAHGQDQMEEPAAWMNDVDEARQDVRVWIRELALQDMLLAGMEAYLVPAGSGKPSTEIYGIVFGSLRQTAPTAGRAGISLAEYNVERVCIQHRAKCGPSEVFADERSEATQLAMGEELFPYWHLLGDFHTHTYRSLSELRRQGGWRYSDADQQVNIEWCRKLRALGHRPRVALILAITRAGRSGGASVEGWEGKPNVIKTTIGRCHCLISAYRIRPDGVYSTDGLTLKCPHLAGHVPPSVRSRRVLAMPSGTTRRRYARPAGR